MLPEATLSHNVPGRMRLRVPARRNDDAYFADVKRKLGARQGILRLETSAPTASLLIIHSLSPEVIEQYGAEEKLFRIAAPSAVETPTSAGARFDAPSLGFLALFGLGLYQITRGNFLAPASTLLSDAFRVLNSRKLRAG